VIRRPYDAKVSDRGYLVIYSVVFLAVVMLLAYVTARLVMTFTEGGYSVADATMAALLLAAELFVAMHAVAYFSNIVKAGIRQRTARPIVFSRHVTASVAILVASFNESEEVLEETLASARAMDYPANLYLLDDSTKPECQEGARRVAQKYRARLIHRTNRAGYKAGAINEAIPQLTEPYVALLDADQKPRENWLKEMVAFLEDRPDLALVQSPQHYTNDAGLPVCHAAKYQQAVFFEFICEGKSYSNAMFCCGSNCVLRREALLSIRFNADGRTMFFDERSVTEDCATTFLLHLKGWGSEYVNQTYCEGMGPETLPAYFTQQMRWAMGTQWQCRPIVREFFRNPRALTPGQWWEYWMVGTYFFIGIPNLIFMLAPMMFMLFGVKAVRSSSLLYLAFFIPYLLSAMNLFFLALRMRGYSAKGVWLASALSFSTCWIYTKASLVTIFKIKRGFAVTPKAVGGAIPLRRLAVELTLFAGNCATSVWCLYHLIADGGAVYAVNGVWSTYHAILLSTLFIHFNKPVIVRPRASLFARTTPAAA
jgi:cellulose synthase (UDP-forming)